MKKISSKQVTGLRQERNKELIQRMRNGDQLTSFNSYASWYPPRPIIQKDDKAVSKLYGNESEKSSQESNQSENTQVISHLRLTS